MKCSMRKIVLPPAPEPTKPVRIFTKSEMIVQKRFEEEDLSRHRRSRGDSWKEAETKTAIDLWEEGCSIAEIAKQLGRTEASVEGKIHREREKGRIIRRRAKTWTEKDDQKLAELIAEGKKQSEIAKELKVSIWTIKKHRKGKR